MLQGHNFDPLYEHSLDQHVEFFSKAGSLFAGSDETSYYGGETTALGLFQGAWAIPYKESKKLAMQLLFWLRNPRGGAGNRSGFRSILKWLANEVPDGPAWAGCNVPQIGIYGRFDDMKSLFDSSVEEAAAAHWASQCADKNSPFNHFACKWAKKNMVPLQRALDTNEAGLRKLIVCGRENIVERAMCAKQWDEITYKHVPSVAMKKHHKAFKRNDEDRFAQYLDDLTAGKDTVHAGVLFPHDVRSMATGLSGNAQLAEAQFKVLPDYIDNTVRRIMVLADTSASMNSIISTKSSVTLMDVSIGMALYCSDRLGKENPFWRKYMEFSTKPTWVDWTKESFVSAARKKIGYVGSTSVTSALDQLLSQAQAFSVSPEQMINTLLILSDMQFDGSACRDVGRTAVERCMARWEAAGYARPAIVYWNLAGYVGQPATVNTPNTTLVSGFSPSILKTVLEGDTFDSREIMIRTASQYEVTVPTD